MKQTNGPRASFAILRTVRFSDWRRFPVFLAAKPNNLAPFLCLHDYLLFRITGSALIDASLASRIRGSNVVDAAWNETLLKVVGASPKQMAPIPAGGVPVGHATSEAAQNLGLPHSVLWVTGGHDQACCSVVSGGLTAGTAVDSTGTFECISIATDDPLTRPRAQKRTTRARGTRFRRGSCR